MNSHPISTKWLTLAIFLIACSFLHAQATTRLSSRFLARGEQAWLEVTVSGNDPGDPPQIPQIKDVIVRPAGFGAQARILRGRKLEYAFRYFISSYAVGKHTIPALEVNVNGVPTRTEPVDFEIFDPNELQWQETSINGRRMAYAACFRVPGDAPFEGETIPVEIKIYVPRQLPVEDWGIPEFERDGVASWRFEPTDMRGTVNLLGVPYTSVSYPSTLTPTRTGKVGIGPATDRLITRQMLLDGYPQQIATEVFLKIPKLEMEARPLPPGAPEGFENAVGSFSIQAAASETEVRQGDPISVELAVTGKGNFDTMRPPKLMDADGWKTYDATPAQRGDERRDLEGNVVFRQFLRPLEMKSAVPPFKLVYFDPRAETYKTVLTEAIPLKMTPVANAPGALPPVAGTIPVEAMTDILANLPITQPLSALKKPLPAWIFHFIGGLIALALLVKSLVRHLAPKFRKDPERDAKQQALKELSRTADDLNFLKAAGRFIESHLGTSRQPELQAILDERDANCFRGSSSTPSLDRPRRSEILRILQKSALVGLLAIAFVQPKAEAANPDAAQTAFDQAKYEEAIQQWFAAGPYDQLSADTLYNIGNATYRMGSPGYAALYYRRALLREPHHAEASQNLRFIERKHGSIVPNTPEFQLALAKTPLSAWKAAFWTGAWILVISALIFPATPSFSRLRIVGIAGLVAAPLLILAGGLAWRYYPDDARFAPLAQQAVIVGEKSSLYGDAARTSAVVTQAPQGSLCAVIRTSGDWSYVAFASLTRGWIPTSELEKLIPEKPQGVPKIRKPKADPNNA
ncbi:MAG: tetratricopeptide repeat protein [Luteolibacter sp.]